MPAVPHCATSYSSYALLPLPPLRRHNLKNHTTFPTKSIPLAPSLPIDDFRASPESIHAADSLTDASTLPLLRHYTRTNRMLDARLLFDEMPEKIHVAWTILMSGYALHGPAAEALSVFRGLYAAGLQPDAYDVSIILRVCSSLRRSTHGKEIHCFGLKAGFLEDLFLVNGLVTMYASCGLLRFSTNVFIRIQHPDLVSWTAMLAALMKNGDDDGALRLLEEMSYSGIDFDAYVFSIGLKASANMKCIDLGMQIHCCVIKRGLSSHSFLMNSLLEFYGRVGELGLMRLLFGRMIGRDLVSWNTMISCCACNLCNQEALLLFHEMMKEGFLCDDFTLGSVLQAVKNQGALSHGKEIHGFTIRTGFCFNGHVNSAIFDMYIKCSAPSAMIPIKLITHFQSIDDVFIIATILKYCASQKDLRTGKTIHSLALKLQINSDPFVRISLIDMYAKCRLIRSSFLVFAEIVEPNDVSWSAIIAGSCFNCYFHEALELFRMMQFQHTKANEFTYTSVTVACLGEKNLRGGKEIHCSIIRNGYGLHASVVGLLINFYIEFREPHKALVLACLMPEGDGNVPWVYLIRAFAIVNNHTTVLWLFQKIQKCYGKLDFLSASYVLDSCVNSQFLNEGIQAHAYFIKRGLVSETNTNTNNSLINMYCRCGTISDAGHAFEQIQEKNAVSWTSIITANVEHGCPSEALQQFQKMIWKDKYPNCYTFLSVLEACRQMRLVDEAFRLFICMIEVHKIIPSVEIYSCMVDILSCAGMFREAEHFIEATVPFESNALVWKTVLSTSKMERNAKIAGDRRCLSECSPNLYEV